MVLSREIEMRNLFMEEEDSKISFLQFVDDIILLLPKDKIMKLNGCL